MSSEASSQKKQAPKAQPATVALFVSDLHLAPAMPATAQRFFDFLANEASRSQQLYLLGDIFEYWAGDDDIDEPFNRRVINALRALADSGTHIFWIAGNRDFLAGERFAQAAGLTILPDPCKRDIAGLSVLLLHGDAQCIDDHAYMAFRQQVRDPVWQQAFLARPLAERKAIIAGMREGSREAQREKSMAIMDVNQTEIDALFVRHGVTTLIHGHTHRSATHRHDAGIRHVLPDWDCDGEVGQPVKSRGGWLAIDAEGEVRRISFG